MNRDLGAEYRAAERLAMRIMPLIEFQADGNVNRVRQQAVLIAAGRLLSQWSMPGRHSEALVQASDFFLGLAEQYPARRTCPGDVT